MVPYSFFYDVDDFKSIGQLFWKMSLNLGMFVFSWFYSDYTFLAEILQKWGQICLGASYQGAYLKVQNDKSKH